MSKDAPLPEMGPQPTGADRQLAAEIAVAGRGNCICTNINGDARPCGYHAFQASSIAAALAAARAEGEKAGFDAGFKRGLAEGPNQDWPR